MKAAAYIFWISLFLVLYTYLFYPAILFCAYTAVQLRRDIDYLTGRRNRRARGQNDDDLLPVTMIVPVYNEEEHLGEKPGFRCPHTLFWTTSSHRSMPGLRDSMYSTTLNQLRCTLRLPQ